MSRARQALRRAAPALPALIYAGMLLAVYWQLWTPIDGGRGAWRYDPRFEYWGDLIFQADTLRAGHIAMWNPFDRAGFPLYGDPQPGLLYPANWPLVAWGALTGELPFSLVSLKILGHALFGALGMHLLARRLGAGESGSYVAGVLFTFTSPRLRYGGSALNWSLAWIPWLALAGLELVERPSRRSAVVFGGTAAMVLLAGAPAVVVYAALVALPLALWQRRGRPWPSPTLLAIAATTMIALVGGLVLGNLEQLPASVRETRDLQFIAHSAFSPAHLVGYLVPRLSGENPYVSLVPLLGALLLVSSARRGLALVLLGIAAAGILLALGQHAGVLPAAASGLPPFGLFRQAHRYLYVASAGLALLGGLGVGLALAEGERRVELGRRVAWLGGLATLVLAIGAITAVAASGKLDVERNHGFALATVSAAAMTALFLAALRTSPRGRRIAGGAIVALLFVDLWTANSKIVGEGMVPPPVPRRDGELARLGDARRSHRIYDHHWLDFRPGTRLGVRDFGGYVDDPLGLSRYDLLRKAAERDGALYGHAGVRYLLEGDPKRPLRLPPPAARRAISPGVTEVLEVAPAVYFVPRAELAGSPESALAALARIAPGRGAVVEAPGGALPDGGAGPSVPGRLTVLEPNRVVAEIDAPGPGVVVVGEAYFPAWRATLDGAPTPIYPANLLFRAIPVPSAGRHVIEMRLTPWRFWGALPFYLIGLGVWVYFLVRPASRAR